MKTGIGSTSFHEQYAVVYILGTVPAGAEATSTQICSKLAMNHSCGAKPGPTPSFQPRAPQQASLNRSDLRTSCPTHPRREPDGNQAANTLLSDVVLYWPTYHSHGSSKNSLTEGSFSLYCCPNPPSTKVFVATHSCIQQATSLIPLPLLQSPDARLHMETNQPTSSAYSRATLTVILMSVVLHPANLENLTIT
jgi:hypothetical protein